MTEQLTEKLRTVLNLELPETVLNEIVVLFADGDQDNWEAENLTYCFRNGPAECPFYKGFFYIPGFSRYVISRQGELVVVRTGKVKKWTKWNPSAEKAFTVGGYMVSHGVSDIGSRKGLSRHRCLCLAFKHPGVHPGELVVNHKNGVPGQDDLDNLEFCTPGNNIVHAYQNNLFPAKVSPVELWSWITGEHYSFQSIAACCEHLVRSEGFVHGRLRAGNNKRHKDGWRIKRACEQWLPLDAHLNEKNTDVDVAARDVFADKTIIFGSIAEAARVTGIKSGSILTHMSLEPFAPLSGWNFRRLDKFEGWPQYTERHLSIFREHPIRPADGIEVYDCEKNEVLFFTSPEKAGEYFEISPITAAKLARYEGTRQNRYKFKLFRVNNSKRSLLQETAG